ncbi:MAG: hypothetical protein AB7P04_10570 [Bacteriovoracia bacterium]
MAPKGKAPLLKLCYTALAAVSFAVGASSVVTGQWETMLYAGGFLLVLSLLALGQAALQGCRKFFARGST